MWFIHGLGVNCLQITLDSFYGGLDLTSETYLIDRKLHYYYYMLFGVFTQPVALLEYDVTLIILFPYSAAWAIYSICL